MLVQVFLLERHKRAAGPRSPTEQIPASQIRFFG
jgi:hypothetical protein